MEIDCTSTDLYCVTEDSAMGFEQRSGLCRASPSYAVRTDFGGVWTSHVAAG